MKKPSTKKTDDEPRDIETDEPKRLEKFQIGRRRFA